MSSGKGSGYYLNSEKEFVIENYTQVKPFSSFLPSISGLYGKPLWVFYVNRGQCISSMGMNNKDYSIMEFVPANKAYRQTSLQGFRTFLKIRDSKSGETVCYEPFQDFSRDRGHDVSRNMYVTSYDVKIEEINRTLGVKVEVMYCTMPGEMLSGLIRKVKITNISDKSFEIETADGLPIIIPYHMSNEVMKNMSNLGQAWMGVENQDTIPFYKIKTSTDDGAETVFIEGGNFYLNFGVNNEGKADLSKTIIDPAVIFGEMTDLIYPERFFSEGFSTPENQVNVGITPCGFGYKKFALNGGETDITYTIIGHSDKYDKLCGFVNEKVNEKYIEGKIAENMQLVESLKSHIFTSSGSLEFDLYCGQSFMDNSLRGGYPVLTGKGKNVFYVYSRKHGDLEREYNFFQVDSTYFSQGNSNFRDVNQNRRNDVCFFPFTGDTNIEIFFNLLQLDGFNPLVLKGSRFKVEDSEGAAGIIASYVEDDKAGLVEKFLGKPFTPGSLLGFMEVKDIALKKGTPGELLDEILALSSKEDLADFGEGYWVDHWTYNSDLLDSYGAVFPDKLMELLFDKKEFTYFDTDEAVMPRDKKYVLATNGVRQLNAVNKIAEKTGMIKSRLFEPNKVRVDYGKGEIYKTSLISKIVCLLVNKIASLDVEGVGIEMEAGKPGWCDSLNGLPGIMGSSLNESMEVKRLSRLLLSLFETYKVSGRKITVPEEVGSFFESIYSLLCRDMSEYEYWEQSTGAKEDYRSRILFGLSGNEVQIDIAALTEFLKLSVYKINKGLEKAYNEDGIYYTYFINEVTEHSVITDENGEPLKDRSGYQYVKPLKFKQRPVPYFLEGLVHIMRTEEEAEKVKKLHNSVKQSELYDQTLGMYKVNVNIMDETKEIGRHNTFPRGWLENEAVFLHLEYKYLLELLRNGLYDEFFDSFKKCLIPFQDPAVYGRSILENSSFIASTVHPDKKTHGTGYVSRLTGASAEFLNMWLYMTAGQKPFKIDQNGGLCLEFKPVLPGWLFSTQVKEVEVYGEMGTEKLSLPANTFAFSFLGKILTVYHNESRKDTFGPEGAVISSIVLTNGGETTEIEDGVIPAQYSREIRSGNMDRIDIYLK